MTHTSLVQTLAARSAIPSPVIIEGGTKEERLARVAVVLEQAEAANLGYSFCPYITETGDTAYEIIIHAEVQP
jgi:hypothetical protein